MTEEAAELADGSLLRLTKRTRDRRGIPVMDELVEIEVIGASFIIDRESLIEMIDRVLEK